MTPPADDLGGIPLHDLFRMEAETHAATIDEGLVALEAAPADAAQLEALMRAAHSVKGAARIVGVTPVVTLAHAMEDAFVAAQKGKVTLGADAVDALLEANDLLREVAKRDEAAGTAFLAERAAALDAVVARLRAVAQGAAPAAGTPAAASAASAPPPAPPVAPTPLPARDAAPAPAPAGAAGKSSREAQEGTAVRVSAAGLGRMLAFAGETLVEARRLGAAVGALSDLRGATARIEAAVEALGARPGTDREPLTALADLAAALRRRAAEHLNAFDVASRRSEDLAGRLYREVLESRMRPFGDGLGGFPRLVRDLARDLGKRVRLDVVGRDVLVDRDVLERLDAPLNHLLRNAVDHGVETTGERLTAGKPPEAAVRLEARHRAGMLEIEVSDDGRGVDYDALRRRIVERGLIAEDIGKALSRAELLEFLFLPGFSTKGQVTEISGRGVGLDVVSTHVRALGGSVRAESETGKGVRFVLTLPITRSVLRAALVEISGDALAFPLTRIERLLRIPPEDIRPVEGRQQFTWEGRPVGLLSTAEVLGLPVGTRAPGPVPVVLLGAGDHLYGLAVDRFLGEQDLVVRPLDPRLGRVAHVSAVSVVEAGDAALILDVDDLLRSIDTTLHQGGLRSIQVTAGATGAAERRRKRVLVVDDSITVREVERSLLAAKGYLVDVAVDGVDGWNSVRARDYDLVVSDVDMPRMDGIELVRKIRQDERLRRLPVMIVSYKDREEDRARGLEAGADAYVTKGSFREDAWIARVVELAGPPEEVA